MGWLYPGLIPRPHLASIFGLGTRLAIYLSVIISLPLPLPPLLPLSSTLLAICNGECGSSHPHSQVYDNRTVPFSVVKG